MTDDFQPLRVGEDGLTRCWWCGDDPLYAAYHDHEWGRPVTDDQRLFEKICLEGFQSGLSWLTILRKRDAFREVFLDFDFHKVARFDQDDVARLMNDARIVRHRGKIESTIGNAKRACEMVEAHGSLAAWFWRHVPPPEERPATVDWAALSAMATTPTSRRLSKALKAQGWTFVGPTTAYAFMEAMGLVNDHLEGCHHRSEVEALQARTRADMATITDKTL